MSDHGLKSIVADMHDMGYSDSEIAAVVQRSARHIGRIVAEICPRPPKVESIADLPPYMRQRVQQWLDQEDGHNVRIGLQGAPELVGSP